MLKRRNALYATVLWILCAASAVAGQIHVVDGAGGTPFKTVQAAVNAATSGDVIVVRAWQNIYDGFTVTTKGLTLIGRQNDGGERPRVKFMRVRALTSAQVACARGFAFKRVAPTSEGSCDVQDSFGHVRLEDCLIEGRTFAPNPAVRIVSGGSAAIVRCTITGGEGLSLFDADTQPWAEPGSHAVFVKNSVAAIYDSQATGGAGGDAEDFTCDSGGYGGDGIHAISSSVFVSGGALEGGGGGDAEGNIPAGCTGGAGAGGFGMKLDQSNATLVESTLVGGPYGFDWNGSGGMQSPGTQLTGGSTVQTLTGVEARGVKLDALQFDATSSMLALDGAAGDFALLLLSPTADFAFVDEGQVRLVAIPLSAIVVGTFPSGGPLSIPFVTPPANPGLLGIPLHVQLVALDVGGATRWSGPTCTTFSN